MQETLGHSCPTNPVQFSFVNLLYICIILHLILALDGLTCTASEAMPC